MRPASRIVLILSAGLNLVLAGILLRHLQRASSPLSSGPAPMMRSRAASPVGPLSNSAPAVTFVTNRFHWRQIESRDYDRYIANLRAVGCPEATLRDIVIADVRKSYDQKAALVPMQVGFWTGGARRAAAAREREQSQRALQTEKDELLVRLLGPDVNQDEQEDHGNDLTRDAIMRFVIGPVPERCYHQVPALMQKWEDQGKEIESQAGGFLLPEDYARLRGLRDRMLVELHRVLTSEQFDEFAQRLGLVGHEDDALEAARLGPGEWRQVARLSVEVYGPFDRGVFDKLPEQEGVSASQDQLFQDGLKRILGETGYAHYRREKDPGFQAASAVAQQNQLPREIAVKVYEIRQLLEAESGRLHEDSSLDPAVQQSQLNALRDISRAEVRKLFGEKAYAALLRQGNNVWLTNNVAP